jgi:hypothetical protein
MYIYKQIYIPVGLGNSIAAARQVCDKRETGNCIYIYTYE